MRIALLALVLCLTLPSCSVDSKTSLSTASSETPLKLWGKANFGAPVADIKALYPDAIEPADPPQVFVDTLGLLKLKNVQIDESRFDAVFYFNRDTRKLDSVMLDPVDKLTPEQTNHLFDTLQVLLSEKYGRVVSQSDKEYSSIRMASRRWVWIDGDREISLTQTFFSNKELGMDDNWSVGLNFRKIDPTDTSNL